MFCLRDHLDFSFACRCTLLLYFRGRCCVFLFSSLSLSLSPLPLLYERLKTQNHQIHTQNQSHKNRGRSKVHSILSFVPFVSHCSLPLKRICRCFFFLVRLLLARSFDTLPLLLLLLLLLICIPPFLLQLFLFGFV